MEFLLGSALAAFLVTTAASWWLVKRDPAGPRGPQVFRAAISFPALSVLLFVAATAFTIARGTGTNDANAAGMVVFAFVFFLVYALVVGVVVGVPTAMLMVRRFRRA